MSSFGGLNIGTTAIHAAQRGLDVTGQNIANSATPGYTRQRVDLESVGGPGVPAFWSKYDGTGEGVKVAGVTRMNDAFLTARANASNASLGTLEEQAKTMAAVERAVGEPSDTGLQKQLNSFWNSWGAIAQDPKGSAPRNATYENAVNVANQLNAMGSQLATQYTDVRAELDANVSSINAMAKDVARLNEAVRNNNIAKVPSNELLDQRDELIRQISELTGATVQPAAEDKDAPFNSQSVDVVLNGKKIVSGTKSNDLSVSGPSTYPTDGSTPAPVKVSWGDGSDAGITAGRVGGQLSNVNTTIPKYMKQFDATANALAEVVNEQQAKGFTTKGPDARGEDLFVSGGGPITARNIMATGGPSGLAVSDTDTAQAINGNNALAMAAHINDKNGANRLHNDMVVGLGVESQSINRNVTVQQNTVRQAEDARDNVSGVSLNEEMTNLVKFQHSFSAAAKFIGVIDQTLDTLIHMTR